MDYLQYRINEYDKLTNDKSLIEALNTIIGEAIPLTNRRAKIRTLIKISRCIVEIRKNKN